MPRSGNPRKNARAVRRGIERMMMKENREKRTKQKKRTTSVHLDPIRQRIHKWYGLLPVHIYSGPIRSRSVKPKTKMISN